MHVAVLQLPAAGSGQLALTQTLRKMQTPLHCHEETNQSDDDDDGDDGGDDDDAGDDDGGDEG